MAQNLVTYSEQLDHANWTKTNATITANSIVAPDGQTTADMMTGDTTNGRHRAYVMTVGLPLNALFTLSCYLKAGTLSWAYLEDQDDTTKHVYFDLTNGVIGEVGTGIYDAKIESVGNGWYRCSTYSFNATGSAAISMVVGMTTTDGTHTYAGTTSQTIYAWGMQVVGYANWPGTYTQTVASTINTGAVRSIGRNRTNVKNVLYSTAHTSSGVRGVITEDATMRPASFSYELELSPDATMFTNDFFTVLQKCSTDSLNDGWGLGWTSGSANKLKFWNGLWSATGVSCDPLRDRQNIVIISYNNTLSRMKIWLNGRLGGVATSVTITQTTHALDFGMGIGAFYKLVGKIGRQFMYNKELTYAEVQDITYRDQRPTDGSLIHSWTPSGSGTTITDGVGGNNATLSSASYSTDTIGKARTTA